MAKIEELIRHKFVEGMRRMWVCDFFTEAMCAAIAKVSEADSHEVLGISKFSLSKGSNWGQGSLDAVHLAMTNLDWGFQNVPGLPSLTTRALAGWTNVLAFARKERICLQQALEDEDWRDDLLPIRYSKSACIDIRDAVLLLTYDVDVSLQQVWGSVCKEMRCRKEVALPPELDKLIAQLIRDHLDDLERFLSSKWFKNQAKNNARNR